MRVAWDLQAVTGPGRTGLGVSVQFMLDALTAHAPEIDVVGLRPNSADVALKTVADRLGWEQWRLPAALRRSHRCAPLDCAYSPALGAPLASPVPVAVHVHDLIPLIYRRQFSGIFARWYWSRLLPYTWRRCSVLTVSNVTVAEDLTERLGISRDRIHVVPYYADPAVAAAALRLAPDYPGRRAPLDDPPVFVTLASHESRKNLELPIIALRLLREQGVTARLVMIGGLTEYTASLRELAARRGVADLVEFAGYLPREMSTRLLLNCAGLLFTSHYEGYGMPPQEAQSIGCPVVLSDIRCHRAVYADPVRLARLPEDLRLVPPFVGTEDSEALAAVMRRLIEDEDYRQGLSRAGLAYSATFGAEATARALVQAFTACRG
ncbi:glycosyltransferase family 4 protein [bacterium]|nr:glycosyltransferase family 4 protein [bacterium]